MQFTNLTRKNNTYVFLSLGALVLGILCGVFLPVSYIHVIITPIATIITRIVFYLTVPYLLFALIITSYELTALKSFSLLLRSVVVFGFVLIVVMLLISMVLFMFIPINASIPLVSKTPQIILPSINTIIDTVFPESWIRALLSSHKNILAIIVIACTLGITAKSVLPKGHSFLEAVQGLRTINLTLLYAIFPLFSMVIFMNSAKNMLLLISAETLNNFFWLLITLTSLLIVLLFIVYPLLLRALKVRIAYVSWLKQLLPAVSVAVSCANVVAASTQLLSVEYPDNPQRKTTDTIIPLSFIFCRVGTAVTIASTYLVLGKIFSAIPISIGQFAMIFIVTLVITYMSGIITSSLITTGLIILSQISYITTQDLYAAIIPLQVILAGIAAGIDVVSCSFTQLCISSKINKPSDQYTFIS